jgi:signal transduction histidine kinase
LYYAKRREFRQSELDLVSAVADGVALALERMDLSERLVADAVANRSVQETNRLKTEFVSTVSHELRTPLTIIKGYTDLLATEQAGLLNETQLKFLQGIQRNTLRLTDLVSDLLDISRLDGGQLEMTREPLDLAQIVADACAEYERVALERNVTVACSCGAGGGSSSAGPLTIIRGDAGRIGQVVNNLLSNAVKYSPPGGTVTLTCEARSHEVVVSVRDRGPGIPLEAQDRLFTKFYRVDSSSTRQVGGTGLGLAIAKAIVEQHGGRIWVESEPGVGTTVHVALPHRPPSA